MSQWDSRQEAADALGVCERTVTRMANDGELIREDDPSGGKTYKMPGETTCAPSSSSENEGWIYILSAEGTSYFKVGHTSRDVHERKSDLQTGCPHRLRVELAIRASPEDEAHLQEELEPCHLRGEWFESDRKRILSFAVQEVLV
ncbi:MAG: GIY-YIG nuclease family protein [Bradymonadaceae bacterium]